MMNYRRSLNEGKIQKGGRNNPPSTQRPNTPLPGQKGNASTILPVLEKQCPACKGSGFVHSEAWAEYFRRENELAQKYISQGLSKNEAVIKAYEDMKDEQPNEPEEPECCECDGRGTVLTDEGLKIISLVRKYL